MGLDVYLYKYDDLKTSKRIQKEYEEQSEAIWKKISCGVDYSKITDFEKDNARKQTKQLEEDMNLKAHQGEKIELNSMRYPLHYFKVGYFRSSYNGSGFNRVVGDAIGIDLYSILNPNDEYEFKPDWNVAKEKTKEAIDKFTEYLKSGCYRVFKVYGFHNKVIDSKEALRIFLEERKQANGKFIDYGNSNGEFMLNGFNINAVINGKDSVFLIYEDKQMTWYLEALEIVLETIEHVLSQPDTDKYVLHWSS